MVMQEQEQELDQEQRATRLVVQEDQLTELDLKNIFKNFSRRWPQPKSWKSPGVVWGSLLCNVLSFPSLPKLKCRTRHIEDRQRRDRERYANYKGCGYSCGHSSGPGGHRAAWLETASLLPAV